VPCPFTPNGPCTSPLRVARILEPCPRNQPSQNQALTAPASPLPALAAPWRGCTPFRFPAPIEAANHRALHPPPFPAGGAQTSSNQEWGPRETHAARGVRRRIPRTTKSWHHRGQCRRKPSLSGTCIPLCGALPGLQTQKIHLGEFREDSPTQPRGTRRRWHRATPLDHWGGRTDGTRPSRHQSAPWLLHSGLPSWFRPDLPRIRKRIN
jgi:hypothetical protein